MDAAVRYERLGDGVRFACPDGCTEHGGVEGCRHCDGTGVVQCECDEGPAVTIDEDAHGPVPMCQRCLDDLAAIAADDMVLAEQMARNSRVMDALIAARRAA